jgi:hypothetical protein
MKNYMKKNITIGDLARILAEQKEFTDKPILSIGASSDGCLVFTLERDVMNEKDSKKIYIHEKTAEVRIE